MENHGITAKHVETFDDKPLPFLLGIPELWRNRHLVAVFVRRDLRLRYQQTFLGIVWTFLQPLLTAMLFALVFGQWVRIPSEGMPYVPLVLSGIAVWLFFSGSIQHATHSLLGNAALITKAYFPRAVLPIASTGLHITDFTVAATLLCAALVYDRVPVSPNLPMLVAALTILVALTLGISLFTAALSVRYRDFPNLVPIVLQLLMYCSPVIYPSSIVPTAYTPWIAMNPLVGIIDLIRWSIVDGPNFPIHFFTFSCPISALCLVIGWATFNRLQRDFSDYL